MFHHKWAASAALLALVGAAGCGSSGTPLDTGAGSTSASTPPTTSTQQVTTPPTNGTITTSTGNYHPKINPADFTNKVDNAYLPLVPGTTHVYKGTRDGVPTETRVAVVPKTRTVMGVKCVVVSDVVTQNHSLVEKTTDWYAQNSATGDVWYFGENTAEYQNGTVTSTAGTWEAGVDHALPGIVMPAQPTVGQHYRQEYRPGIAEDTATILDLNGSVNTPSGTYKDLIVTRDINPLDPTKHEKKWYAKGIGFVHAVLHQNGHVEIGGLVK